MPFVYAIALPTNISLTTSGTTNTEVDDMMVFAGTTGRGVGIQHIAVHGKANAATSISGITFRLRKWTTGSTAGTAITPKPRDVGAQASKCTAAYSPTVGSVDGGTMASFGCGAAGPGSWTALNPDSCPFIEAASGDSLDVHSQAAALSLVHDVAMEVVE